jgi:Ca-activated chloride channel family protein
VRPSRAHVRHAVPFALALLAATTAPLAPALAVCTPDRDALLILDASYSMLSRAGNGMTRFTLARQVIDQTVDLFPPDARIALRLYGSAAQAVRMDCRDSVLMVPFAPAAKNGALIKLALADAHARGVTPIAYALEQAAGDFRDDSIGRTIVLVSDGGEDCNGDPCATAAALHDQGLVINTIGLGVDVRGGRQLQCIAKASGGQYYAVPVAAQLQDKLIQALGICPVALGPTLRPEAATALG